MSACPSPDILARIAGGDSFVEPGDREHAEICADCRRNVAFIRECIAAGIGDIADEAREVEALLAELFADRPARWDRLVRDDQRFHRASVARRLLGLALAARESDTRLALTHSKTATTIVEALFVADARDIVDLRFDAWRYHAMLLRETGQYDRCRAAFVVAREAAENATDPEVCQAIMALSCALLLIEPDVWEPAEGGALLQIAESVFERRDRERLLQTRTVRGMLAHRAGNYEEASSLFRNVLAATPREREAAHADALRNYLAAAIRGGLADDELFAEVEALESADMRAGRAVAALRDRWLRGVVLLARDTPNEAVAVLRDTMRGFEARGHGDTSIRVGIDSLRALTAAQRYEEAVELARDLASRASGLDQRDSTRRRTLTAEAVTYLREAAQRELLTPEIAAAVGNYVDRITQQRPTDFIPPMPLHRM